MSSYLTKPSRTTRPLLSIALVVAAATLAAGSTATGQSSPRRQPTNPAQQAPNPAREAFGRGVTALDAGQFDVAADAFEQSYQLRPVPSLLVNLAIARRGQGRYRDAIAAFERFLAAPGDRATAATIAQANTDMQQLRAQLPSITVHAEPSSGAIAVDGQVQTPGPDGAITIDPGRHSIEVTAEGYQIDRRTMDLRPSAHETLTVRLAPIGGGARLEVVASFARAGIWVDGVQRGAGHVEMSLPPGNHAVDVRAQGYATVHREVHAGITGVTRLDLTLQATGLPRWVVPVIAAAGGALLIGGGIALGAYELRGTVPAMSGSWGTVRELQ